MNLNEYDAVVISSSAGKDSVAMLAEVVELADAQAFPRSRLYVVHADLGRVEWKGTADLAKEQAEFYGLDFRAVSRPQGDLLDQIKARGMFPSSSCRYCTSDQKRGPIATAYTAIARELAAADPATFRKHAQDKRPDARPVRILSCIGFRKEESPARSKAVPFEVNARATGKGIVKTVHNWLPIHTWGLDAVWAKIRASGLPSHYAYDLGMPRLSCVFCIFAPKAALMIAGKHNPELLAEYVKVEKEINHTFKNGSSLAEVQAELDAGAEVGPVSAEAAGCWNM